MSEKRLSLLSERSHLLCVGEDKTIVVVKERPMVVKNMVGDKGEKAMK